MSSVAGMSDGELAALSSEGNEQAFREILKRYRDKILAICLRMLNNRVEAEEAAQDSLVKAYYHLRDFDKARSLGAWIAGISINECRDRLRKRSRSRRIFKEADDGEIDRQQLQVGDDSDDLKARVEAVEKAIELLPNKLREVLVLRAYADHSYEEMAEILKTRVGTVMSRLHRSRQKLMEILKKGNKQ